MRRLSQQIEDEMAGWDWSAESVGYKLDELLSPNEKGRKIPNRLYRQTGIANATNEYFWRVRRYDPRLPYNLQQDGVRACWEPPTGVGGGNRFNTQDEPMLYVARYPLVAALETGAWKLSGAMPTGKFLLSVFGVKNGKGVSFSRIPWDMPALAAITDDIEDQHPGLRELMGLRRSSYVPNVEIRARIEVLDEVLGKLMTRYNHDGKGHEVSRYVVRKHFPLTSEMDGWTYPTLYHPPKNDSDEARQGVNICMLPGSAHDKLELLEVAELRAKPHRTRPQVLNCYVSDGEQLRRATDVRETPLIDKAVSGSFEDKWGLWDNCELQLLTDDDEIIWPVKT